MAIAAILDNLRHAFPGCHYAAYADLSAEMVLATSAKTKMTQEYWDGLCSTAVDMLGGDVAQRVADLLEIDAKTGIFHAVLADGQDLGVFVRSVSNPADALCCVCAPDAPLQKVMAQMQHCLKEIDSEV